MLQEWEMAIAWEETVIGTLVGGAEWSEQGGIRIQAVLVSFEVRRDSSGTELGTNGH